jgi:hypothetical protein
MMECWAWDKQPQGPMDLSGPYFVQVVAEAKLSNLFLTSCQK